MATEKWEVTLLDSGRELAVRVASNTKEGARREARKLHPNGHIIHVEKSEVGLSCDQLRNALEIIATTTYPATYMGTRADGTHIYGGSDDASQYARRILNGEQVS